MNSDAAYYIGKTHKVCQDYAIAKNNLSEYKIILSDGCSGSIQTDMGSRIICETIKNYLELCTINNIKLFFNNINIIYQMMDLPKECLDATLLFSFVKNNLIKIKAYGDGIIILKNRNNNTHIISIEFSNSYPFYLNYLNGNNERYDKWASMQNNHKIINTFTISSDNEIIDTKEYIIKNDTKIANPNYIISTNKQEDEIIVDKNIYKWVSLSSDGLHSFYKTIFNDTSIISEKIALQDIIYNLFDFKNFNGAFVQRRLKKFITITCKNNNWYHNDDISIATIYCED